MSSLSVSLGVFILAGCTFDLHDVVSADAGDAGSSDAAVDAFDADGTAEDVSLDCTPSCQGKCAGDPDGCLGTCATDDCPLGQRCDMQGFCCSPKTCAGEGLSCGVLLDGCGHKVVCGTCGGNKLCIDGACEHSPLLFSTIDAGSYWIGSPTSEPGRGTAGTGDGLDETRHQVALSHAFAISRTEITQDVFNKVMGYNPATFKACGLNCPVETVSWDEAASFSNRLSEGGGFETCFVCTGTGPSVSCQLDPKLSSPYACGGYRLPTEVEWEAAARGGKEDTFYSGKIAELGCEPIDPNLSSIAWYRGTAKVTYAGAPTLSCGSVSVRVGTHPVGQKTANSFGLQDVAGNVWEWTLDCPAAYSSVGLKDPFAGGECASADRVVRGGSVLSDAFLCRHAERFGGTADHKARGLDVGFRIVRSLP